MRRALGYPLAALVVLALAALGAFLWLRTYSPLAAEPPVTPGPGITGRSGTSSRPVFSPVYAPGRVFRATFTLHNRGRFSITLLGTGDPGTVVAPAGLRLRPHDTALVTVGWSLRCPQRTRRSVRLRYRYLSRFTRTESVALPFAVAFRCRQSA